MCQFRTNYIPEAKPEKWIKFLETILEGDQERIEYIQKLVCDFYNIPVEAVKSKTRKREIVQARQIAMYFTKDLTKASLKNIGIFFGGRDHSTVIHACQTVNDLIETDKKFRQDVEEIEKRIKINTF